MLVESWSQSKRLSLFDFKSSRDFSVDLMRTYSRVSGRGSSKVYYDRVVWHISPHKAGEFLIDKDMFRNLPKDVELKPIRIQVVDSPEARKAAAARKNPIPKGFGDGSMLFEEEQEINLFDGTNSPSFDLDEPLPSRKGKRDGVLQNL